MTSREQLAEFTRALTYEHLKARIRSDQMERAIQGLKLAALDAALPEVYVASDPDDNAIIATAIAGRADFIVSGDKRHLLSLRQVEGVRIIAPVDFMALLDSEK